MTEPGRVVALWRKRARGLPMDPLLAAELVAGRGMAGNRNQGGFRQLTVISEEAWRAALAELANHEPQAGTDEPDPGIGEPTAGSGDRVVAPSPALRRANVMVAGLDLADSRGRFLRLGSCRLWILGETRPCRQMDEALCGLQRALSPDWRGGVFGQVVAGGTLSVGDAVAWDGYQAPPRIRD